MASEVLATSGPEDVTTPIAPPAKSPKEKPIGLRPRNIQTKPKDLDALDALERERLVRPHLPPASPTTESSPIKSFLATRFYHFVLLFIQLVFTLYNRTRYAYNNIVYRVYSMLYYHHKTPQLIQKDVAQLERLPNHLSVILDFDQNDREGGLDTLIDDVAEIACWCASSGIPMLSVYERTGILKSYINTSHRAIALRLCAYFGKERPTLRVRSPHSPADSSPSDNGELEDVDLEILFISEEDGRESLVDLTRTLCEEARKGMISVDDVSQELVDAELAGTLMTEPDLLVIFTPTVCLKGYPPWQIRLTELFHVQDNDGVGYQVFLRALYMYAKAEMRFGR